MIISEGTTVPVFPNMAQIRVINDLPVCNKNTKPGISSTDRVITAQIHARSRWVEHHRHDDTEVVCTLTCINNGVIARG